MPILREELMTIVRTHNAHLIKAQKNRSLHILNIPEELYRHEQYGFAVNKQILTAIQATLLDYNITLRIE
jgi:hypothetical protein